ncbi:MAG: DNA polymerase domain-containing protein [Gemmatimonadota bacterium]|nr:DNA polymerase domain-containing protein [Gemmatimonadota bacterium]
MRDRPLVLKRYPDGASGPMFFQQNAGEHVPGIVRVETVDTRDEGPKVRLVGGDLATMLYIVQIGSIEVHPWLSRVNNVDATDRCLIDLDPGDDVPFPQVAALARDLLGIIDACGLKAGVKTSGSSGIHLVIPLPAGVTYDTSAELAMLVARVVAMSQPERATVERSLSARPTGTIYVDPMQNARGKSMACAYSVRAEEGAPVSAPLRARELTSRLRLAAFTVKSMTRRVSRMGDLWGEAMTPAPTKRTIARAMQALAGMLDDAPVATLPKRGQKRRRSRG